jgi:hypothetical protein
VNTRRADLSVELKESGCTSDASDRLIAAALTGVGRHSNFAKADASHKDSGATADSAQASKTQLLIAAQSKMPWFMSSKFKNEVEEFEARASKDSLALSERAKLYKQVTRLIDAAPPGQAVNPGWNLLLAEQIIAHAAEPTKVDQGNHKTCGAAALESQMYTRDPSDAAKFVVDLYLTGRFQPIGSSKPLVLDQSLRLPDSEANRSETQSRVRNYSSQLFQCGAIAMEYEGYRQVKRYYQRLDAGSYLDEIVVGTRSVKGKRETVTREFDGLYPSQVADMNQKITGKRNPLSIIERRDIHPFDGLIHVGSEGELKDMLSKLKIAKRLPAIAFVDSEHEPFWTDARYGQAGSKGGGHLVCIDDYRERPPGVVSVNNQWGRECDHLNVTVQEVYLSLIRKYDTVATLKNAVADNLREGRENLALELELLRQERAKKEISTEQFDRQLGLIVRNFEKSCGNGSIPADEQTQILDELHQVHLAEVKSRLSEMKDQLQNFFSQSKTPPWRKQSLRDLIKFR